MMIHNKTMRLCTIPEFAIVVCAASGTILDTVYEVMVVHHFMQQCGGNFFYGSSQCTGSNVDLMGLTVFTDPGIIPERKEPEGLRS